MKITCRSHTDKVHAGPLKITCISCADHIISLHSCKKQGRNGLQCYLRWLTEKASVMAGMVQNRKHHEPLMKQMKERTMEVMYRIK